MCGRYAIARAQQYLVDLFDVDPGFIDPAPAPSWNVAPTDHAPVVLARPPREDRDAPPVVQLRNLQWGLVPSWATSPAGGKMINARAETIATKPAYRKAFAARRCLVPVDGFYEWYPDLDPVTGKAFKQPVFIHTRSSPDILALAGIYEFWRNPDMASDDDTAWLTTFSIVTTTATDDVGRIHDRMPMTVARDDWPGWLDPDTPVSNAQLLMAPPAAGSLQVDRVSRLVSSVRNNGPQLVDPLG